MFGSPAAEHYELTVCCSLHGQESVLIHVSNQRFLCFYVSLPAVLSSATASTSDCINVFNEGSPSRIRIVLRISLGITIRPRSSIRRTIPVAFIYKFLRCLKITAFLPVVVLSVFSVELFMRFRQNSIEWNQSFAEMFRYPVLEILVHKPWLEYAANAGINKC